MMSINNPVELYQIAYTSTTLEELSRENLIVLLDKARDHNAKNSITGVLLYKNNNFLQVLEGDKKDVSDLFKRIKEDKRHTSIDILFIDPIIKRVFTDWSMGLGISVEDEDLLKEPSCFSFVSIMPFCVRPLYASLKLVNILINFLDYSSPKLD